MLGTFSLHSKSCNPPPPSAAGPFTPMLGFSDWLCGVFNSPNSAFALARYFSDRTYFISNFTQKSRFKASIKESLEKARVSFLGVAEPVDLGICPHFKT